MRLERISINGETHQLNNIVVIIGPNGSGKTAMLQEMKEQLVNSFSAPDNGLGFVKYDRQDDGVWPDMIREDSFSYTIENVKEWVTSQKEWREATNLFRGQMLYRSHEHTLQWTNDEDYGLAQSVKDELESGFINGNLRKDSWEAVFKKSHIQLLDLDNRYAGANSINSIDIANLDNPYTLFLKNNTLSAISKHLSKLFGRKIVTLRTAISTFSLLAIDNGQYDFPRNAKSNSFEAELKTVTEHSKYLANNQRDQISRQSHGSRAALTLLMSLVDRNRKILFIDEPESQIYPSARRYLATLLANESRDRQFIFVTHDPEFVEGIANSGKDFTIVKLDRRHAEKVVHFDVTERRRTSAEFKNTKAVRAGFYETALFVEGTQDRYLYGAIIRQKNMVPNDVEFGIIDCDGIDKISASVKFALDIGTKVAVIVDFDAITQDMKNMPDGSKQIKLNLILQSLNASQELQDQVTTIRSLLAGRASNSKGMNMPGLSETIKAQILDLMRELKAHGVFLVPYGELYDWFLPGGKDVSIAVEDLRNRYRTNSKKYSEVTSFLNDVSAYMQDALHLNP